MSARCPICGKATVPQMRPFCSRRCADVDLAHWLRGDYRVPGEPADVAAELDIGEAELPLDSPRRPR